MQHKHIPALLLLTLSLAVSSFCSNVQASSNKGVHALAMHGEPKYSKNFSHFDYVNPDAPKGGDIVRSANGSFDSFNPFIPKGLSLRDKCVTTIKRAICRTNNIPTFLGVTVYIVKVCQVLTVFGFPVSCTRMSSVCC